MDFLWGDIGPTIYINLIWFTRYIAQSLLCRHITLLMDDLSCVSYRTMAPAVWFTYGYAASKGRHNYTDKIRIFRDAMLGQGGAIRSNPRMPGSPSAEMGRCIAITRSLFRLSECGLKSLVVRLQTTDYLG